MFRTLNRHRRVNSGGRAFNNVGGPVRSKLDFLRRHRFCLSFENSSSPGYTTEKLVDAMTARCVPVYWGNPHVGTDFNVRCMINTHELDDLESACRRVLEVDADRDLRRSMLQEPFLPGNAVPDALTLDHVERRLTEFITSGSPPGKRRCRRRRLREHVHRSRLRRTIDSWSGRLEAMLWKIGVTR